MTPFLNPIMAHMCLLATEDIRVFITATVTELEAIFGGRMPKAWIEAVHAYFHFRWHEPPEGQVSSRETAEAAGGVGAKDADDNSIEHYRQPQRRALPEPASGPIAVVRKRRATSLDYGASPSSPSGT